VLISNAENPVDKADISYVRKDDALNLAVDAQMIEDNAVLLQKIAVLVKKSSEI
jgi:hypothetical protein